MKEPQNLQPDHYTEARLLADFGRLLVKAVSTHGKDWKDLNDVKNIFGCFYPPPLDFTRWEDDGKFGMQRFAGTNNEVIRLYEEISKKLAVTPAMLKPFLEKYTLRSALSNRRLFVIDHSILDNFKKDKKESESVVCSPIALFYRRNDDKIVPIAIQLFQDPADNNPVFLPSDSKYTWILAKIWFNNADACVHQSINHFGYTHIVMEGFEVSVNRHLAQSHPMYKLLLSHFLYCTKVNELVFLLTFLNEGSFMKPVMSIGTEGAYEVIKRYQPKWRLNVDGTLPAILKERKVDTPEVVPDYPFRDDAHLTYNAILQYVTDYVLLYYPSQDYEIQKWRAELDRPVDDGGLGVLGIEGDNGKFTSRDQLIQVVTSIIYTCSASHAAVNFKQYDEYAFPMNNPSKLRGKPPSNKRKIHSERDVLQAIQDRSDHYHLLTNAKNFSEHSFGQNLGNFEVKYICEQKALDIVDKFRAELDKISAKIEERNSKRTIRYDFMHPALILNSMAI